MRFLRSILCTLVIAGILILPSPSHAAADNPINGIGRALCWACWLTGGLANPKRCWAPETGRACRRLALGNRFSETAADDFVLQIQSGIELGDEATYGAQTLPLTDLSDEGCQTLE